MRRNIMLLAMVAVVAALGFGTRARADDETQAAPPPPQGYELATFAGGCFWCMEATFETYKGVKSVTSGYTGGYKDHPKYEEVWKGKTGHAESINVVFDPKVVTYKQLLQYFWHNIDPGDGDGQFCDHGFSYRPEIFYHNEEQRREAEASKKEVEAMHVVPEVKVRISPASTFWVAEEYHQDYYKKNPEHYHAYREGCGRDRRLREIWGDRAGH